VDQLGFDTIRVKARHRAPNRSFTIFLLQQAGAPAAPPSTSATSPTYAHGDAYMWFADPADDDFCPATPGTDEVTPFQGDNEAGAQAFNSANTQPLPAPL
jgi:hypothetical protein